MDLLNRPTNPELDIYYRKPERSVWQILYHLAGTIFIIIILFFFASLAIFVFWVWLFIVAGF